MNIYISKGIPYSIKNGFKVWNDGTYYSLTTNQTIIWKFMFGNIKNEDEILKHILNLYLNGITISKNTLTQTINQLKQLELIDSINSDCFKNIDECNFVLIFKNKICLLKEATLNSNFEKKVYDFLKNYDKISLMSLLCQLENNNDNIRENDYSVETITLMYNHKYSKTLYNTILDFMSKGFCYLS